MASKWTRNQKLLVWGIVVPGVVALIVAILNFYSQLKGLEQKIQPVIEMKPQIVNVINNITRVEKEVANLNEVIKNIYSKIEAEQFCKWDVNKRVKALSWLSPAGKRTIVFFELRKVPIPQSVSLATRYGVVSISTLKVFRNILMFKTTAGVSDVLKEEDHSFLISYMPEPNSNQKLYTIDGLTDEVFTAGFPADFELSVRLKE